jgi:hypothetical protein
MRREEAMVVYQTENERFEKTRSVQWKVTISVWTVIAATIYFIKKENFRFDQFSLRIVCYAFEAFYLIFIIMNQLALEGCKAIWNDIVGKLNKSTDPGAEIPVDLKKAKGAAKKGRWIFWMIFFGAVTMLFLLFLLKINSLPLDGRIGLVH